MIYISQKENRAGMAYLERNLRKLMRLIVMATLLGFVAGKDVVLTYPETSRFKC